MAIFHCGGKEHSIPEMNFIAVERAWPFVVRATQEFDPIKGSSAAIAVIAAGLMESDDFNVADWNLEEGLADETIFELLQKTIKRQMKAKEIASARDTMFQILQEGGLQVTEGELLNQLAEAAKLGALPSQETARDILSSSLLPESKEEAGIA